MSARIRILVTDPINEVAIQTLVREGFDVTTKELGSDELLKSIKDYDALIVRSRTKVTKEVIDAGVRLKVIARAGVGLDNIDANSAKAKNVTVMNSPEAPSVSVAELVFGLMLSIARSISLADASLKNGKWIKQSLTGFELRNKTLGIVGFGRIGREVAKRAVSFEMKVLAFDTLTQSLVDAKKFGVEAVGTSRAAFERLIKGSDFITIHVPSLPETHHMFGEKEFALMKRGAVLINAARGGIVDESSLLKALKDGKISGVGLDVFEEEPPKNVELIKLPNAVCTPHIGAQTVEAQESAGNMISAKIIEYFKKERPRRK
jgi:D-3-phosphoglycerate dehydrogenase